MNEKGFSGSGFTDRIANWMAKTQRPDWDSYFIEMAFLASTRSTCVSRNVGAVLVKDNHVIATGYNEMPSGLPNCADAKICRCFDPNKESGKDLHKVYAAHAEINAIAQSAKHGHSADGATLYCTDQPCMDCAKAIINAGIKRVVYRNEYSGSESHIWFQKLGVEVVSFGPSPYFHSHLLED